MNKTKKQNHKICNFLLFLSFISVIANFFVTILFEHDSNLIIEIISNLLLCIFILFYTFSQITNHKNNKSTVVISSFFIILYSLFQIFIKLDFVNMLKLNQVNDFTNKSLVEVIKWSEKNNVKINQTYEYSDSIEEYHIISQSSKEGTPTKNIKSLDIVVSEGPNPDKEVIVPEMTSWDDQEVLTYIKDNHLNHVNVEFQLSDKNKNTVIEQSKSGNMHRSDELNLIFSLGEEESLEETKLINLKNKSEFEATFYLKQHALAYEIKKEFSSKIKRENVIKQSITMGTMVKPNDEGNKIVLTVSKGNKIKVPDLKNYSIVEITNWAIKNKLKLAFTNQYDDTIKENKVISVNYNKGDIIEQKTLISITISKGKLVMESFDNLDEFKAWANKNNVNYEEQYEFNTEIEAGKIISFSHKKGDIIKNNDTIVIKISQGTKTKIPNLIGISKEEAIKKLKAIHIKYNFVYAASSKEKNTVIKQSLSSGSEVAENTTITLTLSSGKSSTSSSSSVSNNNSTSNSATNDNQTTCDKNNKVHVYLTAGSTGTQTKNNIKSAYPNIKWNFNMVNQCHNGSSASGTICNSSSVDDVDLNYCDTYTVTIVN